MNTISPLTMQPGLEQMRQAREAKQLAAVCSSKKNVALDAGDKKLKDACEQFEALFLDLMLKEMRKTVPKDSLFGDSNEDQILQSMRYTALTKKLAACGGVGLADMMYRQIHHQNEGRPGDLRQVPFDNRLKKF